MTVYFTMMVAGQVKSTGQLLLNLALALYDAYEEATHPISGRHRGCLWRSLTKAAISAATPTLLSTAISRA